MNVIQGFPNDIPLKNAFITIGVYDGVHVGHQKVLNTLIADARAVGGCTAVITFHPHPMRVLNPDYAPPQITCTGHKMRLMEQMGIDNCYVIHFDAQFATLTHEQFFNDLILPNFCVREICVGYDASFGRNKEGTLAFLCDISAKHGFIVKQVDAVTVDDLVVSSTCIRKLVIAGEFELVEEMLGRPYSLLGTVVTGQTLGRQIGYPTANLDPHHEAIPPSGVYIVKIHIAGETFFGMLNIGYRPTFEPADGLRESIEVHILDFSRDIYNQDMEIVLLKKLRDERRFPNADALIQQIQHDEFVTREYIKNMLR
ncbi:MAG: bifunctional riboflavin kinase/FAD synthetase [Candidatus Auribacterota bacterium]|jgi:riboflavin kinase/FMN adenylyltransferase|nr:bifunctional riboflavin kinase/FAD synthetase [Candidatus Auribacterota bacterium]